MLTNSGPNQRSVSTIPSKHSYPSGGACWRAGESAGSSRARCAPPSRSTPESAPARCRSRRRGTAANSRARPRVRPCRIVGEVRELCALERKPAVGALIGPQHLHPAVPHQAERHRREQVPAEGRGGGHRFAVAIGAHRHRAGGGAVGALRLSGGGNEAEKLISGASGSGVVIAACVPRRPATLAAAGGPQQPRPHRPGTDAHLAASAGLSAGRRRAHRAEADLAGVRRRGRRGTGRRHRGLIAPRRTFSLSEVAPAPCGSPASPGSSHRGGPLRCPKPRPAWRGSPASPGSSRRGELCLPSVAARCGCGHRRAQSPDATLPLSAVQPMSHRAGMPGSVAEANLALSIAGIGLRGSSASKVFIAPGAALRIHLMLEEADRT